MTAGIRRIACLGDSITWGYPLGPRYSWVAYLNQEFEDRFFNRGINGDTLADMRRRFSRSVIPLNPTHTIIMGGTNDVAAGRSLKEMAGDLEAMLDICSQEKIRAILALPIPAEDAPFEEKLRPWRNWLEEYSLRHNFPLLDFYQTLLDQETGRPKRKYYCDEVHPSELGYRVMGQAAANFWRRLISESNLE
ncbi:MAG: hypothetical protein PWP65_943 [Clostridia bacterium]|nr:hypothetical protein [Clostridia bacterium]